MKICKKALGYEKTENGWHIRLDRADMYVVFVTDRIVRMRVTFDGIMDEASYVLQTTAWEDRLDGFYQGERTRVEAATPELEEREDSYVLAGKEAVFLVEKDPLNVRLLDPDGKEIYSSVPGAPFQKDSNGRIMHMSRRNSDDLYYGFGEKTGLLNKNLEFVRERATDSWAYDAEKCNSMYKHIPFYIRMTREDSNAVGMYYNNLYESVFNMGELSNYWPRYSYFQADGGDIDLFFLLGGSIKNIVNEYTMLTGRPVLLPKRALGYQGSSMYYSELEEDCDDALIEFVDHVRKYGFPIDGFHLSSGYTTQENNKRCCFTWNYRRFKDPENYFSEMNRRGVQNVPNVKPSLLLVHPMREELEKKGVFVMDSEDPEVPSVGGWWGGPGIAWDFTNPAAREEWKRLLTETVISYGTDSIWDDNCEYDGVWDKDAVCCYEGKGGTIGALKPIMCNLMNKLGYEAVREHNPDARPYIVCRSGGPGVQKYAQNWVGDNYTSWKTLKYNIPILLGMGLSGQPNDGADIGGFAGPCPEEELFVRWVQNGIFQPRFSIHSANWDNTVTEPWMYRRQRERIRKAILMRYRMIPLLYSLEYEAHMTGAPIMRPLVYEFQEDPKVAEESFHFMLGRDLLVANVLEEGQTRKSIYLPAGCKWYDLEHDYREYQGGQTIEIPVDIDSIPRFVREGAILPIAVDQPMSLERDPVTKLHLYLSPTPAGSDFVMYDDDGVTNDFEKGVYRKTTISMRGTEVVTVDFEAEGTYRDTVEYVYVDVIQRHKSPYWISLGDRKLRHYLDRDDYEEAAEGWYYSQTKKRAQIKYANPKKAVRLTVSFEEFDLIGM